MKRYRLSTLLKMCLITISCLAFVTACEKQDKVDTNQLGGGDVLLRSFGPSPIARGAELRIIGANMDKVESVTLQGSGAITDIKRISATEIRVMVPQNAEPGVITLKSGGKDIASITPLTFSEPISITGITPLKAKAGDVIKITGDYLNLIEEIIFTDGVHVLKADFKSQSREEIDVVVPQKAQTGQIIVSNGADLIPDAAGNVGIPIWVYSDDQLTVVLPAITKVSPNPIKAGNLLTIEGTNFDLVDSVAFGGNVGTRKFASHTATKIEVNVPANAADGHIKTIAFSGVPVLSSDSLVLVVPTITSIDPNPVKNGATLTIKGTDLDLVKSVVFGGNKTGEIVTGGTATQIQVKVPTDAKDGVTLNTSANKTVQYAALKMVVPTVTSYTPTSVPAGSDITLKGTDLDLVVSVTFADGLVVPVKQPTGSTTELTVTVPIAAVTGTAVMKLTNGNTVNIPDLQIISPAFAYLATPPAADAEIHAGELLAVEVGNGNKLTGVQVNGISTQFILNDPQLYILIPTRAAGNCELKLISSNGTATYTIPVIGAGFKETVVWDKPIVMSGWSGATSIPKANFGELKPGDIVRFYFSSLGGNPDFQIWYGDWGAMISEVKPTAGTPYYEMLLTADMIQHMMNPAWGSDAILVQGDGVTISKLSVITPGAAETVLWKGSVGPIGWSGNDKVPVDPSQMAGAKTLGIDFTCSTTTNYWQAQVMHGGWWTIFPGWVTLAGGMTGANAIVSFAAEDTNVEFSISQSDIDAIAQQGNAILFGGNGLVITRIYVK